MTALTTLAALTGRMWDHDDHMDGGWWWLMAVGWMVMVAAIVVAAVLVARGLSNRHPTSNPHDILGERFARGEIDDDEYRRRRSVLGRDEERG
jgi:putative membrane protein